ncbi:hypothetical protein O3M35_007606 [Rhynocoris fuscipes]|uniref:Uncharacterized protein n=1 Tax=Rhynocoris fuscipes TaxID=488301 RepID=A0AAW1DBF3_9HEMI
MIQIDTLQSTNKLQQTSEKLKYLSTLLNCEQYQLPPIIITGDYQSGKSSLIENLIGCSFLPKETRCPIEISLEYNENNDMPDWAVFSHAPNFLITDFTDVKQKVESETIKRLSTANDSISDEPVSLKIYSNKFLNLNLVDLPGLHKRNSEGNDGQEIEKKLIRITMDYISNKNCIILVTAALDDDLKSINALKLANQVDPQGLRTLLILTKLDIIDPKSSKIREIIDIFNGKIQSLNLKIIGIINKAKSIQDETFFLIKYYPQIANKFGKLRLMNVLNNLFSKFLTEYLKKLKESISLSYWKHKQSLSKIGEPVDDDYKSMLETISKFNVLYTSTILGPGKELDTKELTGGARINYIFRDIFAQAIRSIDPLRGFSRASLLTAIRNANGVKSTVFIPDICLELLIKKEVKKLENPSLKCVQLVFEEMQKTVYSCVINTQLDRFPKLREKIINIVLDLIQSRIESTNNMVKQLINIHSAYINTAHPDFLSQKRRYDNNSHELYSPRRNHAHELVAYQAGDNTSNFDTDNECIIVENLIASYFNIVRTAIEDCVPKTIMHFLINYIIENLQSELITKLFKNGLPPKEMMTESDDIVRERQRTMEIIDNHEKAINLMSNICESLENSCNKIQY